MLKLVNQLKKLIDDSQENQIRYFNKDCWWELLQLMNQKVIAIERSRFIIKIITNGYRDSLHRFPIENHLRCTYVFASVVSLEDLRFILVTLRITTSITHSRAWMQ